MYGSRGGLLARGILRAAGPMLTWRRQHTERRERPCLFLPTHPGPCVRLALNASVTGRAVARGEGEDRGPKEERWYSNGEGGLLGPFFERLKAQRVVRAGMEREE